MRKVFCDVCGKEISLLYGNNKNGFTIIINTMFSPYYNENYDVCADCIHTAKKTLKTQSEKQ